MLAGVHADYIMRCHTTMWTAPGGNHPFGWCCCAKYGTYKRPNGTEVKIAGYSRKIEQPAYRARQRAGPAQSMRAADERLRLSAGEMAARAVEAEEISQALKIEDTELRRAALRVVHTGRAPRLGGGRMEAERRLSILGRNGLPPWQRPEVLEILPYLDPDDVMLVCPAHCLLRGPMKSIVTFALKSTQKERHEAGVDLQPHQVAFEPDARQFVQVRAPAPAVRRLHAQRLSSWHHVRARTRCRASPGGSCFPAAAGASTATLSST